MDIIASRELSVRRESGVAPVTINIGRPVLASGQWRCDYQIVGLGNERVYSIIGVDGIQALELALKMIAPILQATPEAKEGRLTFDDDPDLGFPSFRDGPPEE